MNHEAVYRTAPATPGPLNMLNKQKFMTVVMLVRLKLSMKIYGKSWIPVYSPIQVLKLYFVNKNVTNITTCFKVLKKVCLKKVSFLLRLRKTLSELAIIMKVIRGTTRTLLT